MLKDAGFQFDNVENINIKIIIKCLEKCLAHSLPASSPGHSAGAAHCCVPHTHMRVKYFERVCASEALGEKRQCASMTVNA